MKYNELSLGQIEAIVNKLGGMEGVQSFLSGETIVKPLERVFQTWKTITLGLHKSADEYRKAIKANGQKIYDWANDIMSKDAFSVAKTEEKIELMKATVAELGFKNGATYKEICDRIVELGYKLCPNEVGPALRAEYKDQPKDEWLRIAMEPITDSDGYLHIFSVGDDDDGVWLSTRHGNADYRWSADYVFVFRK